MLYAIGQDSSPAIEPSKAKIQTWVQNLDSGLGSPVLVIEGASPLNRAEAYRWAFDPTLGWTAGDTGNLDTSWVQEGMVEALTQRLAFSSPQKPSWDILHALLDVEDFVVDGALRKLLDQGFRFTGFFQALWEARHLLNEEREQEADLLVEALIRWMTTKPLTETDRVGLERVGINRELISPQDRLDLLFFLQALARQNGLIDRTVVVFDCFELAVRQSQDRRRLLLQEAQTVLSVAVRWQRLEAGVGIILGLTPAGGTFTTLKQYNPKLWQQLQQNRQPGVKERL